MKMLFEYTSSLEDYVALADVTAVNSLKLARWTYFSQSVVWPISLILASYVAYISPQPGFIVIFLGAILGYVYDLYQYENRYWKAVYRSLKVPNGTIILEVSDDGLHETCESIESFAPWSAVSRYIVQPNRVLIELSGRLWAIVPREALTPNSSSLNHLAVALHERGIAQQGAAAETR